MAKTGKKKSKKNKAKLCKLASKGDYETAAELASGARYICRKCCRVAPNRKNLCKPAEI